MNKAAMNILIQVFWGICTHFSWVINLSIILVGHKVDICLTLLEYTEQFFKVATNCVNIPVALTLSNI